MHTLFASTLVAFAGLTLGLAHPHPAYALTYSLDDGTREQVLGSGSTGVLTFGNHFNVVAGGETITSISIVWGNVPNGTPFTAKLWSDPNGDGNPSDAMLLSHIASVTLNAQTNTFNTYDIADVTLSVGQGFFVGASIIHIPFDAPAAGDTSAPISNQSWASGNAADWLGSTPLNVGTNLGADLMVRATAVPASVPEPAAILLLGAALAGLGFRRKTGSNDFPLG